MSENYNDFNGSSKNEESEDSQDNGSSCSYVSEATSPSPKKPHKHRGLKTIAFILCLAIVGGGSIQVYKYIDENNPKIADFNEEVNSSSLSSSINESSSSSSSSSSNDDEEDIPSLIDLASRADAKSVPDIVDSVMPSVVGVSSTFEYTSTQSSFGGWGWGYNDGSNNQQSSEIVGTGTGIVMTEDGYIVTNAHVIYDDSEYNCGEATDVSVFFSDESEHAAKIIAYDTETDIAVLKIDETGLTPATFGDSDDLRVGELVIAIGNPLGFELFGSVTSGIVSALNREITINEKKMKLIQTDAAINSGNSGGPLLNSCGQVIGINSAKMSSTYSSSASVEGLGFAIPSDEAKTIIDDLINYGYVKGRPQIGIGTADVTETIARYYNIPMGVYVRSVEEGSTAEWAGIQVGDVIIAIQDEPVTTSDELNEIKSQYKAGDEITLTLTRDGKDITVTLVLQEANADNNTNSNQSDNSDSSSSDSSSDESTKDDSPQN